MAIRFCDGLDSHASGTGFAGNTGFIARNSVTNQSSTPGSGWGIFGSNGAFGTAGLLFSNITVAGAQKITLSKALGTVNMGEDLFFCFYYSQNVKPTNTGNANVALGLTQSSAVGTLANLGLLSPNPTTGFLSLRRPFDTVAALATGITDVCTSAFNWVCLRWRPATDTTGSATLYVNGVLQFDVSGIQTVFPGTVFDGGVQIGNGFGGTAIGNTVFDDLLFWDDSGTETIPFPLSARRIFYTQPTSAGDTTTFTPVGSANPNWQVVGRASYDIAATITQYVTDSGTGNKTDLYRFRPLTRDYSDIKGVVLTTEFVANGGVQAQPRIALKTGTMMKSQQVTAPAANGNVQTLFATDAYGQVWSASGVNQMQAGQQSDIVDSTRATRVAIVTAEVLATNTVLNMGQPIVLTI